MNTGDTIKKLRKSRRMTQSDLANRLGVAPTTVSSWERGAAYPLMTTAKSIADIFGVPVSVIAGEKETSNIAPSMPIHSYKYLDAGVSCGAPELVEAYTKDNLEEIQLSDAIMGRYAGDDDILIIHANGESMNRVFPDGALLAVKRTDDLSNGDIVVFSIDNEDFSCKRYYRNDEAKVVSFQPDSDDPRFEPYVYRYEDADNIAIFGKVVVYTVVL